MKLFFHKYHGAGNDFIIIDNRNPINISTQQIASLCHRRFGIGADGLILINSGNSNYNFEIKYFNADGFEGSLCGNGSRCGVDFAYQNGICNRNTTFLAFDGLHSGSILSNNRIAVTIKDLTLITPFLDGWFLNTGSPHFVLFKKELKTYNIKDVAPKLRFDSRFQDGTNVNFVEEFDNHIFVRTYERGVEDETLSCGTGVTAAAIVYVVKNQFNNGDYNINVKTIGGDFNIKFNKKEDIISNIVLEGPVQLIFTGVIEI